jgi:hypothetical protein
MTKPDSPSTIVGLFVVGVVFLLAAWKGEGMQYGNRPVLNRVCIPQQSVPGNDVPDNYRARIQADQRGRSFDYPHVSIGNDVCPHAKHAD